MGLRSVPSGAKRNILRLRLRPKACEGLLAYRKDLASEDWLVPALKTVAMGDTAAVGLAQCAHLGVVLSTGEVSLESFVTLERPASPLRANLRPDDRRLCGTGSCGTKDAQSPKAQESSRPCGQPMRRSICLGMRRKLWKVHPLLSFGAAFSTGVPAKRARIYKRSVPLGFLVLQLVGTGRATADLLDSLVGGLVSCFQYQRRCLSLLQHVYSDPRPRDRQAAFTLSKGIRGGARCCCRASSSVRH